MMKTKPFLGFLLVAALFFIGCKGSGPEQARFISKDASYVMAFDTKSMMNKLAQDSLTVENMLNVLKDDDDASQTEYLQALEIWKQFSEAGLDFDSKVFMAIPKLDLEKGNATIQVIAGLKDAAKLEAFIAKLPNSPKITKADKLSFVNTPDFSIGWDKKTIMIMANSGTPDYGMADTDTMKASIPGGDISLDVQIKKQFALSKEESVVSVKVFNELMKEQADVAIFTSNGGLSGGANPALAFMPRVKEMLDGIYSTSTLNFEAGKMVVKSQTWAGEKLAALLKKYAGPVVDMSLVERNPNPNMQVVSAFSFKPALIPEFVKEIGLDALANLALAEGGSNMDELSKAIKGDFAVMFGDFSLQKTEIGKDASYSEWLPKGKLVVAARIGDKAAFDKLMGIAEKQQVLVRKGNRIIPVENGEEVSSGVFAGVENDLLVFATDSASFYGYLAGKSSNTLPAPAKQALQNQSIAFYADIESIMKGIPAEAFSEWQVHEKRILDESKNVFRHMWFNSENFDGKKISANGEVVMAGTKNSLPQLVRYLMFVADEVKAKEKEEEAMYKKEDIGPKAISESKAGE
jgi:hypothetical protein